MPTARLVNGAATMPSKRESGSQPGKTKYRSRWHDVFQRKKKDKSALETDFQPSACDEGFKVGLVTLLPCLITYHRTVALILWFFPKPQTSTQVPPENSDPGPSDGHGHDLPRGHDDHNYDMELSNDISQQEDLWQNAYKALEARNLDLVTGYKLALATLNNSQTDCAQTSLPDLIKIVVDKGLQDREKKQLVIHLGKKPIKVREQGEKVIKFILWSNNFISAAVSAQPYAALAWSGVSILLPVSCATIQNDSVEC